MGIEVACGTHSMVLSEQKYALEIINECCLLEAELTDFPIEENHNLAQATGGLLDDAFRYRGLVG